MDVRNDILSYDEIETSALIPKKFDRSKIILKIEGILKRMLDIFGGICGVVMLIPLTIGVWIANKLSKDNGPIFYTQERIGQNGKIFKMYKYRSMVVGADEKLKVQDAEKNGINITEKEVDNAIAGFEQTNKIPTGKINSILKQYGISEEAFREQMKSDLAWMRLVRQKAFAGGGITDKDVQKELAVAKADFASPKYQMSEIFISSKNAARASQLAATLKDDPRFEYYAFQFSESPTASNGGKLGWINKESLAQPLQKALEKLKPGQISAPIQVENGYYILRLEQIYTPGSNTHMPTEADIRQFLENQKLDTFATQYIQTLRQKAVVEFRG